MSSRAWKRLRGFAGVTGVAGGGWNVLPPQTASRNVGATSSPPEGTTGYEPEAVPGRPGINGLTAETRRRYGLTGTAQTARIDLLDATEDSARDAETRDAELEISQLRAELAQLNSQLREVSREMRVSSEINLSQILESLPVQMVKDPTFLREIEEFRRSFGAAAALYESVSEANKDASTQATVQAMQKLNRIRENFIDQFGAYRARLELQSKVLEQEIDELRTSISQKSAELREQKSPRR